MWIFEGQPYTEPEEKFHGFVYDILELDTGRRYIGKKTFWSSKILPVTKTRKKRKRVLVKSDWPEYYGSSDALNKRIAETGVDNYQRTIVRLCLTKGECSYWELKLQMESDAILHPDQFYNNYVGARIHSKHLSHLIVRS